MIKISKKLLNNLKEEFKESKYWNDYPIRRRNRRLKNVPTLWKNIQRYEEITKILEERIISIEYEVIAIGKSTANLEDKNYLNKFKVIKFNEKEKF